MHNTIKALLTLITLLPCLLHGIVYDGPAAQKHSELRAAQLARIECHHINQRMKAIDAKLGESDRLDEQLEELANTPGRKLARAAELRGAIENEALRADRDRLVTRQRETGPDILHKFRIQRLQPELEPVSIPIIAEKIVPPAPAPANTRLARLGRWFANSRPARFARWIKNKLWPHLEPFDQYEVRQVQIPHFQQAEQVPGRAATSYERLVRLKRATRDQDAQRLKNLRITGACRAITATATCRLALAGISAYRQQTVVPSFGSFCTWSLVTTASLGIAGWAGQWLYQHWHHKNPVEKLASDYTKQMRTTPLISERTEADAYDLYVRKTGIGIERQYDWARREAGEHFNRLRQPAAD